MPYARRTDKHHQEIRDSLREVLPWVIDTHDLGDGFPDLLVFTRGGRFFLIEIKTPGETYSPAEVKFHKRAEQVKAPVFTIFSLDEALALLKVMGEIV